MFSGGKVRWTEFYHSKAKSHLPIKDGKIDLFNFQDEIIFNFFRPVWTVDHRADCESTCPNSGNVKQTRDWLQIPLDNARKMLANVYHFQSLRSSSQKSFGLNKKGFKIPVGLILLQRHGQTSAPPDDRGTFSRALWLFACNQLRAMAMFARSELVICAVMLWALVLVVCTVCTYK